MEELVPEGHRRAAEEVRAHLVAVRGGAPFLSPADARVLIAWLDEGVAVSAICRAIERAAEYRRKTRSRLPLTLTRAKIHLGRDDAPRQRRQARGAAHPLASVARELEDRGEAALAATLLTLPSDDPELLVRAALHEAREFLLTAWESLDSARREDQLAAARAELVALDLGFDDNALEMAAEELARDELRRGWPMLDAAVLWDAVAAHVGGTA